MIRLELIHRDPRLVTTPRRALSLSLSLSPHSLAPLQPWTNRVVSSCLLCMLNYRGNIRLGERDARHAYPPSRRCKLRACSSVRIPVSKGARRCYCIFLNVNAYETMKSPYPAIEIAHLRKDLHSIRDPLYRPLICSPLLLFASTLRKVAAAAADCAHLYAQVGVEADAYSSHPSAPCIMCIRGRESPDTTSPKIQPML